MSSKSSPSAGEVILLKMVSPVSASVSTRGFLEKEHETGIAWSQKKPAGEQAQGLHNSRESQRQLQEKPVLSLLLC